MTSRIIFITGSDTGAGKTVLAALLTRHLRKQGLRVAGIKPLCSGGRADARALHEAAGKVLSLDEVNPWHFRAALAPLLAARKEKRRVRLREVLAHLRKIAGRFDVTVVEGAGGLLSPLGEDFNSRDLIRAIRARPVVVCPNRLGAVNQALLVLEALPSAVSARTPVILSAVQADASQAANLSLLREILGAKRVFELPPCPASRTVPPSVRRMLRSLCHTVATIA